MRHRNKVMIDSRWVKLSKNTNTVTGRVHYIVAVSSWGTNFTNEQYQEIRKHFDPAGCRGGKAGMRWKFRTREEAAQLVTMAILKFGA